MEVSKIDELVKETLELEKSYLEAKKIASAKYEVYESKYNDLIAALTEVGKKRYSVDGIADISVIEKPKVTTPKTFEAKQDFFGFLKTKLGDAWINSVNINYQTLNSLYNEMFDAAEDKITFSIPGIELPTLETSLRITRHGEFKTRG